MEPLPDGLNFYIGHELGHIRMKHMTGHLWRWPVLWLPLVGAAYARAKESTCDRHGLACCERPESAARALTVLAAGSRRWQTVDLREYARQAKAHHGFWSGFHELVGGYPWLTKRVARVLQPDVKMPGRSPLAYALALFVPNGGRLGSSGGFIMMVAMIGVLAAVALPAYQDYTVRAKVAQAYGASESARRTLAAHYEREQRAPASLKEAGLASELIGGQRFGYDADSMVLSLALPQGELLLVPEVGATGAVRWTCQAGDGLKPAYLPGTCRSQETAR
jgi:type II secretory pathway pseudopilin PulG